MAAGAPALSFGLVALMGCAPIHQARLSRLDPEDPREREAAMRVSHRSCGPSLGLLFPGAAQLCHGRVAEGAVLAVVGAGELSAAIVVAANGNPIDHPGVGLPLVAFQDAWVYGYVDALLDEQRARRERFVPLDTFGERLAAPFNPKVLAAPDVWAGLLGLLAVGIAASAWMDPASARSDRLGDDANLFGRNVAAPVGYPIAAGAGAFLFEHVAVAEETVFRGFVQSSLARETGETSGWLWGSLIFGATHALNALTMSGDQQVRYLAIGVPTITLTGAWLGWSYRHHGYSLAPSIALHFWYDFFLSAVFFAMDPQGSPLSATITIPF